jgi:DNA-binding PadR family transcriptional regulator
MKHTAMVPKGFIRYQVLESLAEKLMSGSEIINEIESRTNGRWKPSPGSIYPLLAWLQDNGHVKELPMEQTGMKRYQLTDSGKTLLEEQRKITAEQREKIAKFREEFRRDGRGRSHGPPFLGPPFMVPPWMVPPTETTAKVRGSVRQLMAALFELVCSAEERHSEQTIDEAVKLLNNVAEKLEEINRGFRGKIDE